MVIRRKKSTGNTSAAAGSSECCCAPLEIFISARRAACALALCPLHQTPHHCTAGCFIIMTIIVFRITVVITVAWFMTLEVKCTQVYTRQVHSGTANM
jgi:hypothetical protein